MRTSVKIMAGLILLVLVALIATQPRTKVTAKKAAARNSVARIDFGTNSLTTLKAFQSSPDNRSAATPSTQPKPEASPTENTAPAQEPATAENDWEKKIDEILAGESDDEDQKARKLLALLPTLPEDGQLEAVTHAANLITDDQYAPLGQLLTNVRTPTDVLDHLMADLANRANSLKLPMYLQVARNADHPNAQEAKSLLELYIENDYGTDWSAWEEAVQTWLREEE